MTGSSQVQDGPERSAADNYATAYGSLHEVVRAFLAGERNARYLRRTHAEIETELTARSPKPTPGTGHPDEHDELCEETGCWSEIDGGAEVRRA